MKTIVYTPADEPRLGILESPHILGVSVVASDRGVLEAWFPGANIVDDPSIPAFPLLAIVTDDEFRAAAMQQLDPKDPSAVDFIRREVVFDEGAA